MKFGAIDIGSNGARLLISRILHENSDKTSFQTHYSFKDVEYIRFPLRLGKDVFDKQKISEKKKEQVVKLMQAFKLIMDLHEVDDSMALATSAFREAVNGDEIVQYVKENVGITIEIIDGSKEAEILNYVIVKLLDNDKNYLHIDVGGGSTELNFYLGRQKFASRSFPMGSIRNVESRKNIEILKAMQKWIESESHKFNPQQEILAVGTGGNINKLLYFTQSTELITTEEIRNAQYYLNTFSFEEKINTLQLNPDRADTIVPASSLYLSAMEWAGAETMHVPELGLKDGMMEMMLKKYLKKNSEAFSK